MIFLPAFNLSFGIEKYSYLLLFLLELYSKGFRSWILVLLSFIKKLPCIGQVKEVLYGTRPRTSIE